MSSIAVGVVAKSWCIGMGKMKKTLLLQGVNKDFVDGMILVWQSYID
jgi:hypothetical protein